MSNIKIGDWIKVPKGTLVTKGWSDRAKSSKEQIVQVTNITTREQDKWFWRYGSEEQRQKAQEISNKYPLTNTYGGPNAAEGDRQREAYRIEFQAFLALEFGSTDIQEVHWEGKKCCAIGDVEISSEAEATAAPAKPAKAPTLRQQMVKGSKWRVLKDFDIICSIDNPDFLKEVHRIRDEAEKLFPDPPPTYLGVARVVVVGGHRNDNWKKRREYGDAEVAKLTIPSRIPHTLAVFKADEVFEVTDKFTQYYSSRWDLRPPEGVAAMWVPIAIERNGETKKGLIPFGSLKGMIEPDSIPTVDIYVLRDNATGKFYGGETYLGNGPNGYQYATDYVSDFMKAKRFDNVGRAKTSILSMTGYYQDLPGSENVPEWVEYGRGGSKNDFKDTWELVKFDKLARREMEIIELQTWYKHAWELRALTVKYGSAVRALYKDLEKRKELDAYKGMVVFYKDDLDHAYYGDRTAFTDDDVEEINTALTQAGLMKGKFRKAKDFSTLAVSFSDASAAMLFKLSYNGSLRSQVINLVTMKEVVDAQ